MASAATRRSSRHRPPPAHQQGVFGVTESGYSSQNLHGSEYHPDMFACTVPPSCFVEGMVSNRSTWSVSTFSVGFFIDPRRSKGRMLGNVPSAKLHTPKPT